MKEISSHFFCWRQQNRYPTKRRCVTVAHVQAAVVFPVAAAAAAAEEEEKMEIF
jgi:hypothetical protein